MQRYEPRQMVTSATDVDSNHCIVQPRREAHSCVHATRTETRKATAYPPHSTRSAPPLSQPNGLRKLQLHTHVGYLDMPSPATRGPHICDQIGVFEATVHLMVATGRGAMCIRHMREGDSAYSDGSLPFSHLAMVFIASTGQVIHRSELYIG